MDIEFNLVPQDSYEQRIFAENKSDLLRRFEQAKQDLGSHFKAGGETYDIESILRSLNTSEIDYDLINKLIRTNDQADPFDKILSVSASQDIVILNKAYSKLVNLEESHDTHNMIKRILRSKNNTLIIASSTHLSSAQDQNVTFQHDELIKTYAHTFIKEPFLNVNALLGSESPIDMEIYTDLLNIAAASESFPSARGLLLMNDDHLLGSITDYLKECKLAISKDSLKYLESIFNELSRYCQSINPIIQIASKGYILDPKANNLYIASRLEEVFSRMLENVPT